MCTLTWISDPRGTRIYFNRDEQRTRLPARPPALLVHHGVRVLAPLDGNAGGTWLSVNEFGLALAILNNYEADRSDPGDASRRKSRGQLVLDFAAAPSPSAVWEQIKDLALDVYRPFILVGIDDTGQGGEVRWDGRTRVFRPLSALPIPLTTSSFRTTEVLAARSRRFEEMVQAVPVSDELLVSFHKSRDPLGGPYSVSMTRPDAMTVSFSAVDIGRQEIRFYYEPRATTGADPAYEAGVTAVMKRS